MFSNLAFAENMAGYPTNIRTTDNGVFFNLNCSPTEISTVQRIIDLLNTMEVKLESIHCDIKRISNPLLNCSNDSSSSPTCNFGVENQVFLKSNHPNYLALIQLLSTSYTTQNPISFELTETNRTESKVSFVLNSIVLK